MRKAPLLFLFPLCLAVLAAPALAQDQTQDPSQDQEKARARNQDQAAIDALVRQLGHEDYEVREKATQKLIELGTRAVPALEKATRSEDLEVRLRAGRALRAIRGAEREKLEEPGQAQPGRDSSATGPGTGADASGTATSFKMQISPGEVTVTLTEIVDGKPVTTTYKAASVEELKKKYPELQKHLGNVRFRFGPAQRDPFDMDRFWKEWNRDFDDDMKRFRDDLQRDMDRWQRWLDTWRQREVPEWARSRSGPILGVRASRPSAVLDAQLRLGGRGVVLDAVEKGSLADDLGLERFDVLLELNGKPIRDVRDIADVMREHQKGDPATAKVIRRARPLELTTVR